VKKRGKSGLPRGAGAFTAVILGAALAAGLLDRFASSGAKAALGGAVLKAEAALGISISYDRASPSVFGSLGLSSLSLSDSESRSILQADRVEAVYSLAAAATSLLGKKGIGKSLERVTLSNVEVDLDMRRDSALLASLRKSLETGSGDGWRRGSLEISARRVRLALRDPDRGATWSAEIRSLDIILSEREVFIALEGSLSGVLSDPRAPLRRITVPVTLKGSSNRDFTAARFNISVAARSDAGTLERQEFSILLREGVVEARKVRDDAPFDLYARYDIRSGALGAELRFESLYLSRIGNPSGGRKASLEPWFQSPYTGRITLEYPESLKDPHLDVEMSGFLPPGFLGDDFSFRLAAEGGMEGMVLETLEVRSLNGAARVYGTLRPDLSSVALSAEIDYRARDGRLPVLSNLRAVGEGRELLLYSDSTSIGGVELSKLAFFTARNSRALDFRGSFDLPQVGPVQDGKVPAEGGAEFTGKRVSWEGSLILGAEPFLETTIIIDPYDLAPLEPLLASLLEPSSARMLAGFSLGGRISLSSDFARFSYSASDFRIAPSGSAGRETFVVLNLSGTAADLSVSRFIASLRGYPVEGRLDAEFDSSRIGFRTEFSLQDIPYVFQGEYDDRSLLMTGDYGFSLVASLDDPGARGAVSFRSLPMPVFGGVVLSTGEVFAEVGSWEDWSLRIASLALEPDGSLKGRLPVLRISGSAGPEGGNFPEIVVEDGRSRLQGSARYTDEEEAGGSFRAEVDLSGETGEALRGSVRYSGSGIDGRLDLKSFSIYRLFGGTTAGTVDGSVSVSGTLSDPRAEFSLALREGSIKGRGLSVSAEGSLDRNGLELMDASGRFGIHQAQNVQARVGFRDGAAEVSGAYAGFLAGGVARFRFAAEGELVAAVYGPGGLPDLSEMARTMKIRGRVLDFSMGKNKSEQWPFALERHGRELVFQGGASSEVNARLLDDGSFLARLVPPFPLSAVVVGKVADRQIAMDLSDISMEMTTLWPLIPIPEVRFLSGIATGSLSVRGNSADPEIYGSLRFQDAILEVPNYVNAPIGPITSPLEANGRQVSLVQPVVDVGQNAKAGVSLSFEMSQWIPRGFSLRARSLESTQVPLKTRFLGMNISGTADADILLSAEDGRFNLTGALTIPRAEIVIDPSIIQYGGDEDRVVPRIDTRIDLDVRIGKGVTVYFPSKEFPVIIGQADPSSRLSVSYDDKQQSYALKGSAVLRGGNLFYIQRNFFLKNGKMVFNENQYSFDPRVTLEAELRTRRGEDTVKILLKAENASLVNFQPTLESTPSLSQTEIAALLGSELIAADEGADLDIRRTLITSTDILPQLNFINIFERNTRQLLGLDLFYLRTELVQRWLLDVARLDEDTEGGVTLADYLDNTSIFAGKYLRDDVFIRGSLRLQQDQPLVNRSSLRLDSEIGFELATPFFLFDWNLAFLHPEDLFISDNSFRFTWKLTY